MEETYRWTAVSGRTTKKTSITNNRNEYQAFGNQKTSKVFIELSL